NATVRQASTYPVDTSQSEDAASPAPAHPAANRIARSPCCACESDRHAPIASHDGLPPRTVFGTTPARHYRAAPGAALETHTTRRQHRIARTRPQAIAFPRPPSHGRGPLEFAPRHLQPGFQQEQTETQRSAQSACRQRPLLLQSSLRLACKLAEPSRRHPPGKAVVEHAPFMRGPLEVTLRSDSEPLRIQAKRLQRLLLGDEAAQTFFLPLLLFLGQPIFQLPSRSTTQECSAFDPIWPRVIERCFRNYRHPR